MNVKHLPSYPRAHKSSSLMFQFLIRFFIPSVFIVWVLFLLLSPSSAADHSMLRGKDKETDGNYKQLLKPSLSKGVDNSISSSSSSSSSQKQNQINHAIIVAGHAVMKLSQLRVADRNENAWYLLPYQLGQGFPEIITSHIKKGIDLSVADPKSLLIFSGGQTRRDVGPTSEAASYYYLAQEKNWMTNHLEDRIFLDEFKEVQGTYPSKITVIGFDFKADRFTTLHRKAIKFPESNFTYVGIKPNNKFDYNKAVSGEKSALDSFTKDLYGCNDPALKEKRQIRNPFKRSIPYELACPELRNLFNWCGPNLFPSTLPWETNDHDVNVDRDIVNLR